MTNQAIVAAVLASAVLHAMWNALIKREPDSRGAAFGVLAASTSIACVCALALDHDVPWSVRGSLGMLAAGVFEGIYFVALGRALDKGDLGAVYAFGRGGALLIAWPLSIALLGESFRARAALGALIVTLGLVLCGPSRSALAPLRPSRWVWVIAFAIAAYHLGYKFALVNDLPPRTLFAGSLLIALPMNYFVLTDKPKRYLRQASARRRLVLASAGALSCASFLILLGALRLGGTGAVLTLRNTSVVFAQGFALLIGEAVPRGRWVGAMLIAAGAALVTA